MQPLDFHIEVGLGDNGGSQRGNRRLYCCDLDRKVREASKHGFQLVVAGWCCVRTALSMGRRGVSGHLTWTGVAVRVGIAVS